MPANYQPDRIRSKKGYDPQFLGIELPLPEFGPELIDEIVDRPELREGVYADYLHYTVATHKRLRTPVFAALNIDQNKIRSVRRTNNWRIDTRVGPEFQLNNDYYRSNPWDRGHLVRRATAAWGDNTREAKHASDDTFFYANASLQHANFNQDEWLALEEWVKDLGIDDTNKVNSVSGPIWGVHPRSITPQGRDTALIPTAFFKVISFIKNNELEVRAFIMAQDSAALADKQGKRMFDNQRYQVSVTEIEELTGLIFPSIIPDTNPLFFNDSSESNALGVITTPEHIEVDTPNEVIGVDEQREAIKDEMIDVFIMAAMVNPKGAEREGEWITVLNLSDKAVNFDGWYLRDKRGACCFVIDQTLEPGEAMRVKPVEPMMLGNNGGHISLWNEKNERVDRVKYTSAQAGQEGKPIWFNERSEPISSNDLIAALHTGIAPN